MTKKECSKNCFKDTEVCIKDCYKCDIDTCINCCCEGVYNLEFHLDEIKSILIKQLNTSKYKHIIKLFEERIAKRDD